MEHHTDKSLRSRQPLPRPPVQLLLSVLTPPPLIRNNLLESLSSGYWELKAAHNMSRDRLDDIFEQSLLASTRYRVI